MTTDWLPLLLQGIDPLFPTGAATLAGRSATIAPAFSRVRISATLHRLTGSLCRQCSTISLNGSGSLGAFTAPDNASAVGRF